MNQKLQSPLFWTAILGALKLVLDAAGIQLPGDKIDSIANGIAAMLAVIGVVVDHGAVKAVVDVPIAVTPIPAVPVPNVVNIPDQQTA